MRSEPSITDNYPDLAGVLPSMERLRLLIRAIAFTGIAACSVIGVIVVPFGHLSYYSPNRSKSLAAAVQMSNFATALRRYHTDCGTFPSEREGLDALVHNPGIKGWRGPYMSQDIALDPWGFPYQYKSAANGEPQIRSFGAERVAGTLGREQTLARLNSFAFALLWATIFAGSIYLWHQSRPTPKSAAPPSSAAPPAHP